MSVMLATAMLPNTPSSGFKSDSQSETSNSTLPNRVSNASGAAEAAFDRIVADCLGREWNIAEEVVNRGGRPRKQ